jgi:hypothetical protein
MKMFRGLQLVKKALLQGVPSPEGDGIKLDPVISGGVYLGNDTSVFQMTVDSVGTLMPGLAGSGS